VKETVIKAPVSNAVDSLLNMNGVSLTGGNSKGTSGKEEIVMTKKKMVVMTETRTLGMNNNLIKTINGLGHILDEVMWASNKLLWIDLSHNHLTNIDEDIASHFPLVKTFYLHANYISDMSQI
jgi:hypothetical protein